MQMLRTPALSGQSVHFNPEKLKTDHGKGVIADNSKDIICLRCEEKEELKTSWARTAWELHCGSTSQHAGDNIILTAYQMSLKVQTLIACVLFVAYIWYAAMHCVASSPAC